MFCWIGKSNKKRRIEELATEKSELQQRIERAEAKNAKLESNSEKFVEQISELNKMLRETIIASTEGNQIQINKVSINLNLMWG